jgi:hypothetical protein
MESFLQTRFKPSRVSWQAAQNAASGENSSRSFSIGLWQGPGIGRIRSALLDRKLCRSRPSLQCTVRSVGRAVRRCFGKPLGRANRYSAQLHFVPSRCIAACAPLALDAYVTFKMFFHPVGRSASRTKASGGFVQVHRRVPAAYVAAESPRPMDHFIKQPLHFVRKPHRK